MKEEGTKVLDESEDSKFGILVVDDQEEILDLTKICLKRESDRVNVETSKSPIEALEKFEDKDYDMIISDYRMPEMNGIEFLKTIRESDHQTQFIILTGKGDENVAAEAVNIGADGYIQKEDRFRDQVEELANFILDSVGEDKSRRKDRTMLKTLEEAYNIGDSIPKEEVLGEGFEEIRNFFSILSKEGTFNILNAVKEGLRSQRKRWEEFRLSKRQYYSRLRSLKNVDIIKKKGEDYVLTEFGEKATNLMMGLGILVNNVVNEDEGDNQEILEMIGNTDTMNSLIENSTSEEIEMPEVRMQDAVTYKGFVEQIIEMVGRAEEELYIATSFADQRVLRSLIEREPFEIDLKILMAEKAMEDAEEISEKLLGRNEGEKMGKIFEERARSCRELSFSFGVRNSEELCVEVKNPLYTGQFFLGFVLEGEEICESFRDLFEELYQGAENSSL